MSWIYTNIFLHNKNIGKTDRRQRWIKKSFFIANFENTWW